MKKIYYFINAIIIIFGVALITINLIGFKTFRVISDSMAPDIRKNDLAIVKKIDADDVLEVEDIIAFNVNGKLVLHEIVEILENNITTKGKANETNDAPITYDDVVGIYVLRIPLIGILFSSIYLWVVLLLVILGYYIIIILIKEIKKSSGGK